MKIFAFFTIGTLFVGMGFVHGSEIINQDSAYSSAATTPQVSKGVIAMDQLTSLSIKINGTSPYAYQELLDCEWDLDDDDIVGASDLLELFAQWGTDGHADFDDSGAVGTIDMLILFANWGLCK